MRWSRHVAVLLGLLAPAAHAQFSLYQVSGNADLPVGSLFSLPTASPNMPEAVTFLLRNTTTQAKTLALLSVSGVGFSLNGPATPLTLQAGNSVQFTVTFQGATIASYSGSLVATGVAVTLIAIVAPALTYEVQLPSGGTSALGAAALSFGSVQVGSNATVNLLAVNLTANQLTVPAIAVAAGDFALAGPSPSGTSLDPQSSASFAIKFTPTATGTRTAVLSIGSLQFTLTGTGEAAPRFSLYQLSGSAELPVGAQFSFGSAYPNQPDTVAFGILNTTSQTQTVTVLSVSGPGFSLAGAAAPMSLKAGDSVQFTISFQGAAIGSYTGSLDMAGIAVALTANVTLPSAQFSLFQVSGGADLPVGTQFSFGSVYPNLPDTVTFGILNITTQTVTLNELAVSGAGFSINAAAPMSIKAGASVLFTLTFEGATAGSYTGTLNVADITVALAANVTTGLTYEVQLPSGPSVLGAVPVSFGTVQMGSSVTVTFLAVNQTTAALTVDPITVAAGDFALLGNSPSGMSLAPQASTVFSIQFAPAATGARTAVLSIGSRQFTLTGTGAAAPMPTPQLLVTPGELQSAQQGSVSVGFNSAAESGGSGTVTLAFEPLEAGALDPGIVFAAGGQTVSFTFSKGDTAASFGGSGTAPFQTGTTAGTLRLAAQIGSAVSQQNVVIAPAVIDVASVTGTRQTAGLMLDVTGFDNTRTAGNLSFTFYDSSGNAILPGAINYDSTAAFTSYFDGSGADDGGQFMLGAYFPVNGNPALVSGFTVQLTNSAGTTTTPRASF